MDIQAVDDLILAGGIKRHHHATRYSYGVQSTRDKDGFVMMTLYVKMTESCGAVDRMTDVRTDVVKP